MKGSRKFSGSSFTTVVDNAQFNLKGHCIFCLRKINGTPSKSTKSCEFGSAGEEIPSVVPEAVVMSPNFAATFNGIWPYMYKNWKKQNNLINDNDGISFENVLGRPSKDATTFTFQLPTICQFCANKVQGVEDLMNALRQQIRELRGIIHESKKGGQYSWRGEQFESSLRGAVAAGTMGENMLTSTLDFLNSLGCSSSDEENIAPSVLNEDHGITGTTVMMEATNSSAVYMNLKIESSCDDGQDDPSGDDFSAMMSSDSTADSERNVNDDDTYPLIKIDNSQNDTCVPSSPPPKKQKVMTSRGSAKTKRKMHPETRGKFLCSCGTSFSNKQHRRRHYLNHCKNASDPEETLLYSKKQTCDLCGVQIPISKILEHIQTHIGDYAIKCPSDACSQVYSNHHSLMTHVRGSRKCKEAYDKKGGEFTCDTCGFKTDVYFAIRGHVASFHERDPNNKLFKCPIASCDKSFSVRQSVQFHLIGHQYCNTTLQKCDHCGNKVKTEEIDQHLLKEHGAQEIFKCGQCPFVFLSRVNLMEHMFAHRHIGMYCHICDNDVMYTKHMDLREHYHVDHGVAGDKYICEHCSQEFWRKDSWVQHMRVKHSKQDDTADKNEKAKEKKRFTCDTCEAQFTERSKLLAHKIKDHGDLPFSCSLCESTFREKTHLSRHEKEHAGIKTKKEFKCEIPTCGKIFTTKRAMKNHVSGAHLGERGSHVCDTCGMSYRDKTSLKQHHDLVHLGIRSHVCGTCGECFAHGSSLTRHKLIHTGERPFCCELCGQRFRHKEVLKRHVEAHERKGVDFKPNGPMKQIRKRKTP